MSSGASELEQTACPCGSGNEYGQCCGRYLNGGEVPQTAEQLMRSRYCGFVLRDEPYLLATWHPETRPSRVRFDEKQRWLGLRILTSEAGGLDDSHGIVEFVARFKINGKGHRLHEISRFEKIDGRWYYRDGRHL
jgi:SEC-C motif domain protein